MQFLCKVCGFEFTRTEPPEACPACGSEKYEHLSPARKNESEEQA